MKIRTCFVSNSSSSSFLIHKSAFKNSNDLNEFIKELRQIEELDKKVKGYDEIQWGDSERTFEMEGNFIFLETFHAPSELFSLLKKYEIDRHNPDVYDCDSY